MREQVVAIVATSGRSHGMRLVAAGADPEAVAEEVMRYAFDHFMAPEPMEAFAGACGALYELYPDDAELRAEVQAIGDRNRVLLALESGVPVNLAAVELAPFPERQLGLAKLMRAELARKAPGGSL